MCAAETSPAPRDDDKEWWRTSSQDPLVIAALQGLVGDRLYAVTFILDYVQLQFNGHGLNAWTTLSVIRKGNAAVPGALEFRNELCRPIGRNVVDCRLTPDYLSIVFDDCEVRLSLAGADYVCPEAGELHSSKDLLVFRTDRIFVFPK
jgi:hypothetical protein